MKTILLTVSLLCSITTKATNYYFSSLSGVDSRSSTAAQNHLTPWKTLDKLNSFFPSLKPGDSVLLKRGEIFYGTIILGRSGTRTKPINIGGLRQRRRSGNYRITTAYLVACR